MDSGWNDGGCRAACAMLLGSNRKLCRISVGSVRRRPSLLVPAPCKLESFSSSSWLDCCTSGLVGERKE
jgi:hypothetical protein